MSDVGTRDSNSGPTGLPVYTGISVNVRNGPAQKKKNAIRTYWKCFQESSSIKGLVPEKQIILAFISYEHTIFFNGIELNEIWMLFSWGGKKKKTCFGSPIKELPSNPFQDWLHSRHGRGSTPIFHCHSDEELCTSLDIVSSTNISSQRSVTKQSQGGRCGIAKENRR